MTLLSKRPRFTTVQDKPNEETLTSSPLNAASISTLSTATSHSKPTSHSNLFLPFRTIGIVTNGIPFQVQKLGTHHFLTTSIGSAFHVYNVEKLKLVMVSDPTPSPITCLAVFKEFTFVACENEHKNEDEDENENEHDIQLDNYPQIYMYKRGKLLSTLMSNHGFEGNFIQMMVFGEYLVALNDTANYLMVWLYGLGEVYTSLTFKKTVFDATCFLHPHTYLNKLLIGSIQGTMQLWNIKTNQLIYSFSSFKAPITCLAQSPIIDVIALGLQNGKVILHHLKLDETLFSFEQQSKVTAIAFRSDEHAIMATANEQGDIAIWDLSKKRLMHQLKNVHCCSINSMEFLVGQPILMTSAADNSIKQYLFDAPESEPRLLKSRSGHTQPPTLLRFYDEEGQYLLTSSKDRALRLVRVERDAEHIELSQGAVLKKSRKWKVAEESLRLSPILGLASNPLQQRDWDTIVTCHANDPVAHTWSFERRCLSHQLDEHPLTCLPPTALTHSHSSSMTPHDVYVSSVVISPCGHYCVLGSSHGGMYLYNLQSGLLRQTFKGHSNQVTGLFMTHLHQLVSISLDTTFQLWHTKSSESTFSISFPSPLTLLIGHLDTDLVAITSDDFTIRILDLTSKKVVREFWGHVQCITDLCFSPDGRWLISTSLDSTMKTWDLPSGALVDVMKFQQTPVSVAFSPDHGYIATAHVGVMGICLWTNRHQFSQLTFTPLTPSSESIDETSTSHAFHPTSYVTLPSASAISESNLDDDQELVPTSLCSNENKEETYVTPEQLVTEFITFSSQPRSVWMTLLNLDTIKERNKPKQPIQQPPPAPFFLPTTSGVVPSFIDEKNSSHEGSVDSIHDPTTTNSALQTTSFEKFVTSPFTKLLYQCSESHTYDSFLTMMESLSPSELDLELRLLHSGHYIPFLESILQHIRSKKSFELGQSWLNVFLKHHSDPISKSPSTLIVLRNVFETHEIEWKRIEQKLRYCHFLLDFIREG